MFRVIDLDESPLVAVPAPGDMGTIDWKMPHAMLALPSAVLSLIENTGEGAEVTECSCGSRVGHVFDDSDDLTPRQRWGAYSIWGEGEGVYRVLCGECSQDQASPAVS